jgi:hypothetical protein
MILRICKLSVMVAGLLAPLTELCAAEASGRAPVQLPYAAVKPSASLASRLQKEGDYATAVLVNEAILQESPSDRQALQRMLECHEALVKIERKENPAPYPRTPGASDDGLTDLPDIIPADTATAQPKPPDDHNPPLL